MRFLSIDDDVDGAESSHLDDKTALLSERERYEADISRRLTDSDCDQDPFSKLSKLRSVYTLINKERDNAKNRSLSLLTLRRKVIVRLLQQSIVHGGRSTVDECVELLAELKMGGKEVMDNPNFSEMSRDGSDFMFLDHQLFHQLVRTVCDAKSVHLLKYLLTLMSTTHPLYIETVEAMLPVFYEANDLHTCYELCKSADTVALRRTPVLCHYRDLVNEADESKWKMSDMVNRNVAVLKSDDMTASKMIIAFQKQYCRICDNVYNFKPLTYPKSIAELVQQMISDYRCLLKRHCSLSSPFKRRFALPLFSMAIGNTVSSSTSAIEPDDVSMVLPIRKAKRSDISATCAVGLDENIAMEITSIPDKRRSTRGYAAPNNWVTVLVDKIRALLPSDPSKPKSRTQSSPRACHPIEQIYIPPLSESFKGDSDSKFMCEDLTILLSDKSPTCIVGYPFIVSVFRLSLWLADRRFCLWQVELMDAFMELCGLMFKTMPHDIPIELALAVSRLVLTHPSSASGTGQQSMPFFHAISTVLIFATTKEPALAGTDNMALEAYIVLAAYLHSIGQISSCSQWLLKLSHVENFSISTPGGTKLCCSQLAYKVDRAKTLETLRSLASNESDVDTREKSVIEALTYGFSDEVVEAATNLLPTEKAVSICCRIMQSVDFLSPDLLRKIYFDCSVGTVGESHGLCILTKLLRFLESSGYGQSGITDCDEFWMWLHSSFEAVESIRTKDGAGNKLPASIQLIDLIHENLGKHSRCCRGSDDGGCKFLRYATNKLYEWLLEREQLHCTSSSALQILEQCIHCLWGASPIDKRVKAKYIIDHNSSPVAMTIDDCRIVYDVLSPHSPPVFTGPRAVTAVQESDDLIFCKIEHTLNWKLDQGLTKLYSWLDADGEVQSEPDLTIMKEQQNTFSDFVDLYYLIADCFFKSSKLEQAKSYYLKDLCLIQDRFDTWAALSICYSSQIETKLAAMFDYGSDKTDPEDDRDEDWFSSRIIEILSTYRCMSKCFNQACKIRNRPHLLLVEIGTLNYTVASNFSKILDRGNLLGIDEAVEAELTRQRLLCLDRSRKIFEQAHMCKNEDHGDEWYHLMMLGKLCLKRNRSVAYDDLCESLNHYCESIQAMMAKGAIIPDRISHETPATLSKELAEIHYLAASACLKYSASRRNESPGHMIMLLIQTIVNETDFVSHTREFDLISYFVDGLTATTTNSQSSIDSEHDKLIKFSLKVILAVVKRSQEHYKSYYRLAWFFSHDERFKNSKLAAMFLLNPFPTHNLSSDSSLFNPIKLGGLFSRRTKQNLFNNIWRINCVNPHNLERISSFPYAMCRSVELLINLLSSEPVELCNISKQLYVRPDNRNKYVSDTDRMYLCRRAYFEAANGFVKSLTKPQMAGETAEPVPYEDSTLKSVYSLWMFSSRSLDLRDSDCQNALLLAYKQVSGVDADSMDTVLRFCQNRKAEISTDASQ